MHTMIKSLKELVALLVLIEVCGLVLSVMLHNTIISRIWLFKKKSTESYIAYRSKVWMTRIKLLKKLLRWSIRKYKKIKKNNRNKKQNKKVVNGNNIVDFKTAKELRHKWNK